MEREFMLRIQMGNAAMGTLDDIAEALEQVVKGLREGTEGYGIIRDLNGNRVGSYKIRDVWAEDD